MCIVVERYVEVRRVYIGSICMYQQYEFEVYPTNINTPSNADSQLGYRTESEREPVDH